MKIAKGHYVPKDLITSEAVHKAVVKCFVAAGFNKIGRCNYGVDIGAGSLGVSARIAGGVIENPLTLQQLFTADNGLSWPDWAESIIGGDRFVYFKGDGHMQAISGDFKSIPFGCDVLATRQPKEKEAKTIKDAVIALNGKLPDENEQGCFRALCAAIYYVEGDNGIRLGSFEEFEAEAKLLGYINGYRWGVEYPTNGKRPELPSETLVKYKGFDHLSYQSIPIRVAGLIWDRVEVFKIIDADYKPADTSYLNASTKDQSLTHSEEGLTHSWNERGELPPVGSFVSYHYDDRYSKSGYSKDWIDGDKLEILSHKTVSKMRMCVVFNMRAETAQCLVVECMLPIRTERERFIDAAKDALPDNAPMIGDWNTITWVIENLFSAGFRGPKVEK